MMAAAIEIFSAAFYFFMQVFPHAEAKRKLDNLWVEQRARLERKSEEIDRTPKAWEPGLRAKATWDIAPVDGLAGSLSINVLAAFALPSVRSPPCRRGAIKSTW
jgi:hypothetical protein